MKPSETWLLGHWAEEGDTDVTVFFLCTPMCPISNFFPQWWKFCTEILDLHKGSLTIGGFLSHCFSEAPRPGRDWAAWVGLLGLCSIVPCRSPTASTKVFFPWINARFWLRGRCELKTSYSTILPSLPIQTFLNVILLFLVCVFYF